MGERERALGLVMVDALNRRDAEGMKELTHPEAEFSGLRSALEGTSYVGRDGIDRFLADTGDARREFEGE